jgi:hypothetical protein
MAVYGATLRGYSGKAASRGDAWVEYGRDAIREQRGRDDGGMYTEWEEGKESCGKNRIESRRWDVDVR